MSGPSNWTAEKGALYPFVQLGTGAGSGQVPGYGCHGMRGGGRRPRRPRRSISRQSRRPRRSISRQSRRYRRSISRQSRRSNSRRPRKSRRMRFRGGFAPINENMSIETSLQENNIPSSQYYGVNTQLDNNALATPIPIISSEKCPF